MNAVTYAPRLTRMSAGLFAQRAAAALRAISLFFIGFDSGLPRGAFESPVTCLTRYQSTDHIGR